MRQRIKVPGGIDMRQQAPEAIYSWAIFGDVAAVIVWMGV